MAVDLDTLKAGDTILFRSKNTIDNVQWTCKINGICQYSVVRNMSTDLLPYYQAVKQVVPIMEPLENLTYFILEYYQDGKTSTMILAKEWIEPTSVSLISINSYIDFRIFDIDTSDITTVLNLLKANGFTKCKNLT